MTATQHSLMGGHVHLYKRPGSTLWQSSTFLAGRNYRVRTKEESLTHAKDFPEDWYVGLKGKQRAGELKIRQRENRHGDGHKYL